MPLHTRLCLSGGGIRAVSYIGALETLSAAGALINIDEYLGVSAGAFIAFLICIGYSLTEMRQIMNKFDFGEIREISTENFLEFDENYGIDDGERLMKVLTSLMKIKGFSPDLTFAGLPKRLRIFATDLKELQPREFSAKRTPNVPIITALRASMAIPFYFTPVRDPITNHLLTDGAVIANYPMVHLNNFEALGSIGLAFNDHTNNYNDVENIFTFFHQVMSCFWIKENSSIYSRYAKNTIIIPCSIYPAWNFEATEADKKFLYDCGITAAKKFLEQSKKPSFRRRSVA